MIRKALLQIAVFVFFLNATVAYGACCFAMSTANSEDAVVMEMPCHRTDDNSDAANLDDRCPMCVPLMALIDAKFSAASADVVPYSQASLLLMTSGIDPPFRPPIDLLS